MVRWRALYEGPAEGWDFGEFEGRVFEQTPRWSYRELAKGALRRAGSAVDLGTGGGEFLLGLADVLPDDTHATEGWAANIPVARRALQPRGVSVAVYDVERGDVLPHPDDRFDLVLSRHGAYAANEVAGVLKRGGAFLTQQVDGRNLADLAVVFGAAPAYPTVTLEASRTEAEGAGLVVRRAEEWTGTITFIDVDCLVSYLRFMPWQLPDDFTVDTYARQLMALERSPVPLSFTETRFLLICEKP